MSKILKNKKYSGKTKYFLLLPHYSLYYWIVNGIYSNLITFNYHFPYLIPKGTSMSFVYVWNIGYGTNDISKFEHVCDVRDVQKHYFPIMFHIIKTINTTLRCFNSNSVNNVVFAWKIVIEIRIKVNSPLFCSYANDFWAYM